MNLTDKMNEDASKEFALIYESYNDPAQIARRLLSGVRAEIIGDSDFGGLSLDREREMLENIRESIAEDDNFGIV